MSKQSIANGLNGVWFVLIIVGLALGSDYFAHVEYWQKLLVCVTAGSLSFVPQFVFNVFQGDGHQDIKSENKEILTSWLFGAITALLCLIPIKNYTPVWIAGITLSVLALVLHGGIFRLFSKK